MAADVYVGLRNQMTALLLLIGVLGVCGGLDCWVCIADNCREEPATNYKATTKTCTSGESCQKVEFRGRDAESQQDYFSVVRSCSQGVCYPHSDNCSESLLTNPGCMTRHCCGDKNRCNSSPIHHAAPLQLIWVLLPIGLVLCDVTGGLFDDS